MLPWGLVLLEEQGISKFSVCTFGKEAKPLHLTFPFTHTKSSMPEILSAGFSDSGSKVVKENKCSSWNARNQITYSDKSCIVLLC